MFNTRFALQFGDNQKQRRREAPEMYEYFQIHWHVMVTGETNWSAGGLARVPHAGDIWYAVITTDALQQLILLQPLNSDINLNYAST